MNRKILLVLGVFILLIGLSLGGTASALPMPDFPDIDPPQLRPDAPGALTAEAVSSTVIELNWDDKSDNESNFFIHRKLEGAAGYTTVGNVGPNVTNYQDTGLTAGTKYYYVVTAANSFGGSSMSNEASATTKVILSPDIPFQPIDPDILDALLKPKAPSDLEAEAVSSDEIDVSWNDNANNEDGFILERSMTQSSGYEEIADLDANDTFYEDEEVEESITYFYRIKAYNDNGDSAYSALASAKTPAAEPDTPDTPVIPDTPPANGKTILKFYIDNDQYLVNNTTNFMDTAPMIKDNRTLLPIRYVATPLGAVVGWDPIEQKVSITLDDNTIHLWINKNTALVNGVQTAIDPLNSNVTPIIVPPGRTMLPLRFIAENLDCKVEWSEVPREAKVTYPK